MASRKKLDFQHFGAFKAILHTSIESALRTMYKEIREFDVDHIRPFYLRTVPVVLEIQGEAPATVKNERILVFDRDCNLMVDVPQRRLVQYASELKPRELSAGLSLRSALLALDHPPDVRHIVYVQLWSEPFPNKKLLTYMHRDNGVCVYDEKIKWVSFPELGNGQADEFEEYVSPIMRRREAENKAELERSRRRAEGERMIDMYIRWPLFLRVILPLFGKLKPPSSDNPNIRQGINDHKERLGLYGKYCQSSGKSRPQYL